VGVRVERHVGTRIVLRVIAASCSLGENIATAACAANRHEVPGCTQFAPVVVPGMFGEAMSAACRAFEWYVTLSPLLSEIGVDMSLHTCICELHIFDQDLMGVI
jgi:hypothetical protein